MALFNNPLFSQLRFGVLVIGVQIVIIILFVIFVQYGDQANKDPVSFFNKTYAAYDDVHNYYASARSFLFTRAGLKYFKYFKIETFNLKYLILKHF